MVSFGYAKSPISDALERHAETRALYVIIRSCLTAALLDVGNDFLAGPIWALGVLIAFDVVDDACGTQIPEFSGERTHSGRLEAGSGAA